jgi:hypothetical protein
MKLLALAAVSAIIALVARPAVAVNIMPATRTGDTYPPVTVTQPPRLTYVAPQMFSDVRGGASLALAPHAEPYHLGQPVFVELWFHTVKPHFSSFNARSGLHFVVTDPHGSTLPVSKPIYMRAPIEYADRGVGVLNGESFLTNLADQYAFSAVGTYGIIATVILADPKGVTLTSPPVSILVEK